MHGRCLGPSQVKVLLTSQSHASPVPTPVTLQVRCLMGQVRPDRQTLLFTATMPTKVDNLVRDCLTTPVRITVGEIGAANQDIQQARALDKLLHHV